MRVLAKVFPAWLAAVALLLGAPAWAYQDIDLDLVSDGGRSLPQYPVDNRYSDSRRAYVEAEPGMRYSIRVRNNLDVRVGLVIAVDGRNIISGQASDLSNRERMYILRPGEQASYAGWRTGRDRVNRFYFTEREDSYAYAWDDTADIGVIAVAVYREKTYTYRERKAPEGLPAPGMREDGPGTGFGEDAYAPSRQVQFDAESRPGSRYYIRYEWRENLCRKGVLDCDPWYGPYRAPDSQFAPSPPGPGYRDEGYADEPPRRWRR